MRAITVSVDYGDLLSVCMPRNRHHFDEVMIVTTPTDTLTHQVASENDCRIHVTQKFYERGAAFNKYAAMEEALDAFGRHGWMVILDADVIWPESASCNSFTLGNLYTPRRHMLRDTTAEIPFESEWHRLPVNKEREYPGYTQIFHADDQVLPQPPWHQTDWRHAGGADSAFQALWPRHCKIRPSWHVLHIGESFVNWSGRATPYRDGTIPDGADENRAKTLEFISNRKRFGHNHERL